MERSIDKIDTKTESELLISLFYKIELKFFLEGLIFEHYESRGSIKP